MICTFLGWKDGLKKDVPFVHENFCKIYHNLLDNMAELKEDTFQHMKLGETRRQWARDGM